MKNVIDSVKGILVGLSTIALPIALIYLLK